MPESSDKSFPITDLSGGAQKATTRFLKKDNELDAAENADFTTIGGLGKKLGYTQEGSDLTSTTSTSTSTSTTSTSTSSSSSTSSSTSTSTTV